MNIWVGVGVLVCVLVVYGLSFDVRRAVRRWWNRRRPIEDDRAEYRAKAREYQSRAPKPQPATVAPRPVTHEEWARRQARELGSMAEVAVWIQNLPVREPNRTLTWP